MQKTEYQLHARAGADLTLAVVSDLHLHDPAETLRALSQIRPAAILVPGDLFERHEGAYGKSRGKSFTGNYSAAYQLAATLLELLADLKYFLKHGKRRTGCGRKKKYGYKFIRRASRIAPVFLSPGNHEKYYTRRDRKLFRETGTVLLKNSDILWNGIRIGGLDSWTPDPDWLREFDKKDGYKILLCHHPEYYDRYLTDTSFDLILAGHAHGGQMRLFGHGIYAPGQGFFPKYHHGLYHGRMIVSAGAVNTLPVPRWGNPPEVVVVRLRG